MNSRRNTFRLTAAALLATAALGACAENSSSRDLSMDGRWPNWSNNGTSQTRSTTLGPSGGSSDGYDYADENGRYNSMNSAEWNANRDNPNYRK